MSHNETFVFLDIVYSPPLESFDFRWSQAASSRLRWSASIASCTDAVLIILQGRVWPKPLTMGLFYHRPTSPEAASVKSLTWVSACRERMGRRSSLKASTQGVGA